MTLRNPKDHPLTKNEKRAIDIIRHTFLWEKKVHMNRQEGHPLSGRYGPYRG